MPISTISTINVTLHTEPGEPTVSQTLPHALLDCSDLPTHLVSVCIRARSSLGTSFSTSSTVPAQEGDVESEEGSKH